MMLGLVYSLTTFFQIAFGAEPLASIQ